MKRNYTKPTVMFESFQLACAIAGDCTYTLNIYSYICAADENMQGMGPSNNGIFYDYNNCQFDLTGPELDGADSMCYHGPFFTGGTSVFLAS